MYIQTGRPPLDTKTNILFHNPKAHALQVSYQIFLPKIVVNHKTHIKKMRIKYENLGIIFKCTYIEHIKQEAKYINFGPTDSNECGSNNFGPNKFGSNSSGLNNCGPTDFGPKHSSPNVA